MLQNRIFAIGDIHGCCLTLLSLLFNELKIRKSDVVYFMGDYSDRGPKSKEVLDFLIGKIAEGYSFRPLMGNHEKMMLDSVRSEENFLLWQMNGAQKTLDSFKVKNPQEINDRYFKFLEGLPYFYETNEYLLVHAGINCLVGNPLDDTDFMLWTKDFEFRPPAVNNLRLIIGHRPTRRDELLRSAESDLVKTDCGCVYTSHYGMGFLAAYDMINKHFILQQNCENNES